MVKIISFIVFITAFIWTWNLFNSRSEMGIEIHAGIQSKLTLLIEDTLKSKKPSLSDFKLIKMYTTKIDDQKVSAHFAYEYTESIAPDATTAHPEVVTQNVSGEAILIRGLSEDKSVQKWVLQSVKTDAQTVDFKDGILISSEDATAPATESSEIKTENK